MRSSTHYSPSFPISTPSKLSRMSPCCITALAAEVGSTRRTSTPRCPFCSSQTSKQRWRDRMPWLVEEQQETLRTAVLCLTARHASAAAIKERCRNSSSSEDVLGSQAAESSTSLLQNTGLALTCKGGQGKTHTFSHLPQHIDHPQLRGTGSSAF